ncbi:alpha/beta hydrolase [Novipirellula herctigrandis]|uniref:alpha/beta hydrolase n=1 Tax=Novipirellula herctigrandis TaxID=2527986 RepID=UPI003AF35C04
MTKRSKLLRLAMWLLLIGAALAPVWLIYEWYDFAKSMPDRGWNFQVYRIIGLVVANLIFSAILATMAILFLWVRLAKSLPDLQGWHLQKPESEFRASDAIDGYSFNDYLAQEDRVFQELDAYINGPWASHSPGDYSRYHQDSVCNPATIADRNWNRSHVLRAANPIGGVLLIHGLSDSPYSLRTLGQRLHAEGYTVVWLRVPGHGTSPSALAKVVWQDWTAAVQVAMQGLRAELPKECPLILGGYSNGGALSIHYTLCSLEDSSLPKVDAIVLFSPMIGINPMARITRVYHTVALVSRNKKAQWSNISAEVDPYKFSSWPMNANVQAWAMTKTVEKKLATLEKSGRMAEMPPVLAMQSMVDSTVVVPKLITVLFDRLKSESSELFLFDIDRVDRLSNLFNLSFEKKIFPKLKRTDLPYTLSVLRNSNPESRQVLVQTRDGESWEEQTTDMYWPESIVSLSHIAVPIPSDDRIYGTSEATADTGLSLGSLTLRGEPSALLLSSSLFVRCRHNPFYRFMEDRVVGWLSQTIREQTGTRNQKMQV